MFRHTRSRARRSAAGAIALTLALSLAAMAATGAGAAVPSQKVDKAAVLRFGLPLAENGGIFFDPSNSVANPFAREWMDLIYDTMIHETPDGKGAPGLATKWSTPDPSTVELTLREGMKFTDGAPFNAAAVKAAWDRMLVSGVTTIPTDVKAITSIEAVNDNTVRLRLNRPVAKRIVETEMKNSFWLAVPSPAAAAAGTLNSKPVGAGPYLLDSFQAGQKVILKKNPTFYDPKAQKLAGVEFTYTAGGAPSVSALQAGAVDIISSFGTDALETIQNQPGLKLTSQPGTRVFDVGLCATEGVFASKDARQAIQYAIDRDAINAAAVSSTGTSTVQALTPVSPLYDKSLEKTYSFNPKKAKALLKQAGVAPGTTVKGLVPTAIPQPAIAEIVQSQLKDVGLNLELTSSTSFSADAARLKPDIAFVAMDPSLHTLAFEGTNALNVCSWRNAELSAAYQTVNDGSKTLAEQKAAWATVQKILLDESPVVYLVAAPLLAAHTDKVKGLEVITTPSGPILSTVYMTK